MGETPQVHVEAPDLPRGYVPDGVESRFLAWADVEARLRGSTHYWVATTRPDRRPHVIPRWGVWIDGHLWYDGSPETRHARNLEHNTSCALHLESGSEVVIVNGKSHRSDPIQGAFGDVLSAEFARKYADLGYLPEPTSWSDEFAGGLRRFDPETALAWTRFPTDLTRFRFVITS